MIRTLMLVDWINLKRDRVALALTFILPIVFFSIFAMIFGGMSGGTSGGGPRSGGTTILLTTHGLEEAQQVCETIVIIDHGKAIAAGTFHELLQQTIGSQRRVIIHVNHDDHDAESNEKLNIRKDGTIERSIENVSTDLHALLDELAKSGVEVKDLHLESPSLQDVFIHLTGRELRE